MSGSGFVGQFPDIEKHLTDYLRPLMTVNVYTRVPDPRPDSYLTVRRNGGQSDFVVDVPTVELFSVAPNDFTGEQTAMETLTTARELLQQLAGTTLDGVTTYRVDEIVGPTRVTDPDTGDPAVMCMFALRVRQQS